VHSRDKLGGVALGRHDSRRYGPTRTHRPWHADRQIGFSFRAGGLHCEQSTSATDPVNSRALAVTSTNLLACPGRAGMSHKRLLCSAAGAAKLHKLPCARNAMHGNRLITMSCGPIGRRKICDKSVIKKIKLKSRQRLSKEGAIAQPRQQTSQLAVPAGSDSAATPLNLCFNRP